LGGKRWGKTGAYVALAAILGSFGLSSYGLILYTKEFSPNFFPPSQEATESHEAHGAAPTATPADHLLAMRGSPPLTDASAAADIDLATSSESEEAEADTELDDLALDEAEETLDVRGAQQSQTKPAEGEQVQPQQVPAPAGSPPPPPPPRRGSGGGGGGQGPTGFSEGGPYPGQEEIVAPKREPGVWRSSFNWFTISNLKIRLGFYVDSLTVIMFFMVTMVASLIHLFSMEYMHEELHDPVHDPLAVAPGEPPLHRKGRYPRFFTYLSLFCFSMLGLVLSDNAFMVFMFWEAVGICSYLLIGFYYERKSASTAANKAFITNRVGDAGFIVGLMILWSTMGTFNIQDISRVVRDGSGRMVRLDQNTGGQLTWDEAHSVWVPVGASVEAAKDVVPGAVQLNQSKFGYPKTITYALLTMAGIGIFIGCVGKSAQFPLHVWLPDAMEGPTPVSALIHAATMVAAGVYFVGRFYALFTPTALLVIAYTGAITLFLAGTIALVMTDIKKVLAYSTVSQLGYMMLGLGVGGWAAGLFHLLTHAFFKALLFLGSGSVIHGTGTQEMPQMGGLWRKMPVTAATMLVGVLAICGIPGFSGYFSKDAIVAQALYFWQGTGESAAPGNSKHVLLFLLPAAGAAITAFYMFRLFFLTFLGTPRDHHVYDHAHESKWQMWLPLVVLAIPSVIVGYGFNGATPLLERILTFHPPFVGHLTHVPHEVHLLAGKLALMTVLFGIGMAILFYGVRVLDPAEVARQFPRVYQFLLNKWYFDELYDAVLVRPTLLVARLCRGFDANVLDRIIDGMASVTVWWSRMDGWFDFRFVDGMVNGVSDLVYGTGNWLRRLQTGQLRQYVMFLAVGAVGLFAVISYLGADILKTLLVK
jgi:NADH-quinone oxidoreductase subunit L